MAKTKKYVVTLTGNETGTLNNDLFRKMASKGDITSTAISDLVDEALTIRGTAQATIETDEKTFILNYYDTEEKGIVHCGGGTLFEESYLDYSDVTNKFFVKKIKCKLGYAFKAVPDMAMTSIATNAEALPFN